MPSGRFQGVESLASPPGHLRLDRRDARRSSGFSRCERPRRAQSAHKDSSSLFTFICFRSSTRRRFPLQFDLIVINRGTDEIFKSTLINLIALEKIDRSPRVASEARVEDLVRIWEARPVGKGKLHLIFVGVADRDDSVVRPHWLLIHFHSSMISRSASRMLLRMLASVFPRQSVSSAISSSINAEADSTGARLFILLWVELWAEA